MSEHSVAGLAAYFLTVEKLRNKQYFPVPIEILHEAVQLMVDRGDLIKYENENGTVYYTFPSGDLWLRKQWRKPMPWDDTMWSPRYY